MPTMQEEMPRVSHFSNILLPLPLPPAPSLKFSPKTLLPFSRRHQHAALTRADPSSLSFLESLCDLTCVISSAFTIILKSLSDFHYNLSKLVSTLSLDGVYSVSWWHSMDHHWREKYLNYIGNMLLYRNTRTISETCYCIGILELNWKQATECNTTTTKPFVPSIWGRLHEPKENYAGSGTWIKFLHSFLSSSMPSFRLLNAIHLTKCFCEF